jgi:exodeoxyribonuclease VII large subunit
MTKVYKVSQIVREVKWLLEDAYGLIAVEGEVSEATRSQRGHLYFVLKDEQAELRCVMWSSLAGKLPFKLETGRMFICAGNLTVYEARGTFQMDVKKIEPQGIGALKLALEQRARKLEAEGLFSPERKRTLPLLPQRIGVITSPDGAALQDFLKILEAAPVPVEVRVFPAQVQGKSAAGEVAAGIKYFQKHPPDVIVITRGGGSFEDLMPFNEEFLVRAVVAGRVPLVSAVGHEVDITLCDRAADLRVPTPTAAAQEIVARLQDVFDRLQDSGGALADEMLRILRDKKAGLDSRRARVSPRALQTFVQGIRERLHARLVELHGGAQDLVRSRRDTLVRGRLSLFKRAYLFVPGLRETMRFRVLSLKGIRNRLRRQGEKLAFLRQSLHHLNLRETLKRGYAVLRKDNRAVIRSEADVRPMESIEAQLYDGRLVCQVREKKKE